MPVHAIPRRTGPLPVLSLTLLLALAGCLGGADPAGTDDPADVAATRGDDGDGTDVEGGNEARFELDAPTIAPGTTWTYEATGVYDRATTGTVVYTPGDGGGHLLAGASPEDLLEEAMWGRAWFGPFTEDWRPIWGGEVQERQLFDFPLWDGKTWPHGNLTVTATEADIATPSGTERGFRIHKAGTTPERYLEWTYAPSVGFLTTYISHIDGLDYEHIQLTAMGTAGEWTWYEAGDPLHVGGEEPSAETLQLEAGWDGVVLSAGGVGDGHVALQTPITTGQGPWTMTMSPDETWHYDLLPPTEGPWAMAAESGSDGWAYGALLPVRWVTGPVG